MIIFGPLVYGTFVRHYCRRNGMKFLSPKWLVTKRPCPLKFSEMFDSIHHLSFVFLQHIYKVSGLKVGNSIKKMLAPYSRKVSVKTLRVLMNDFEVREVLFRRKKSKTDICPYCRKVDDTAHFLFSCVSSRTPKEFH